VVRDALRSLEERKFRLEALRVRLGEGAAQAARGEFVSQSVEDMLGEFKGGESNG